MSISEPVLAVGFLCRLRAKSSASHTICEINCLPQTCGNHREVKLIKLLQKMISKDDILTLGLGFLFLRPSRSLEGEWEWFGEDLGTSPTFFLEFLVCLSCFFIGRGRLGVGQKRVKSRGQKAPKASNYGPFK